MMEFQAGPSPAMPPYPSFPPEANSSMFTSGVGVPTWVAASGEWAEFGEMIFQTITELTTELLTIGTLWQGTTPTAAIMKMQPMLMYLTNMGEFAMDSSMRCDAICSTFSALYATMPPLPQIVSNRSTWATLMATNIFGINTPEINSLDAEYFGDFWPRAAGVMTDWHMFFTGETAPVLLPKAPPLISLGGIAASEAEHVARTVADTTRAGLAGATKAVAKADVDSTAVRQQANQGIGQMMGQMQSIMSPIQQAPQMVQQATQPLQQIPQAGQQVMQSAQQFSQMGSQFSHMGGNEGSSPGLASSSLGQQSSNAQNQAIRTMNYGYSMGSGGVPSSWNSGGGLSSGHLSGAVGGGGAGASLATPGNTKAAAASPGGMGGGGAGGAPRNNKKSEDRVIERKFLDDVDAFGNVVDNPNEEFTEQKLRDAIKKYT